MVSTNSNTINNPIVHQTMYHPNVTHPSHYHPNPIQPGMVVMPPPTSNNFVRGHFHMQSQRVLQDSAFDKVVNTNRAMDPKMLEFKQFCTSIYGTNYLAQIVSEEKSFAFLFYHVYCVKKGKGKRLSTIDSLVQRFGRADYDKVMLATSNLGVDGSVEDNQAQDIGNTFTKLGRCMANLDDVYNSDDEEMQQKNSFSQEKNQSTISFTKCRDMRCTIFCTIQIHFSYSNPGTLGHPC